MSVRRSCILCVVFFTRTGAVAVDTESYRHKRFASACTVVRIRDLYLPKLPQSLSNKTAARVRLFPPSPHRTG